MLNRRPISVFSENDQTQKNKGLRGLSKGNTMVLAFVAIVCLLIIFTNRILSDGSMRYYKTVGIKAASHTYEDIVKELGSGERTSKSNEEILQYDGFSVVFPSDDPQAKLKRVEVTGEDIRFGEKSVGVGSSKDEITKVYQKMKKIQDLPEFAEGYVDGTVWVVFFYDQNNTVRKIFITDGG